MLQWLGTDCIREQIDQEFWLKRFGIWYDDIVRRGDVDAIFITDIRFRNEADMVQRLGGKVVRVVRGECVVGESVVRGTESHTTTHISETQLDTVVPDVVVHNDASVGSLQGKINELMATGAT